MNTLLRGTFLLFDLLSGSKNVTFSSTEVMKLTKIINSF